MASNSNQALSQPIETQQHRASEGSNQAIAPYPHHDRKISTLANLLLYRAFRSSEKVALSYKKNQEWESITWKHFARLVENVSRHLIDAGIQAGDKVVLFSHNRYEWVVADLAIMSVGGVSVPIYATNTPKQANYILEHSEAKLAFASDVESIHSIQALRQEEGQKELMWVSFDPFSDLERGIRYYKDFEKPNAKSISLDYFNAVKKIKADDLATIIYTSGTTGQPKGVMLSHNNIISNAVAAEHIIDVGVLDSTLSFLPLSHALERMAGLYTVILFGGKINFAESIHKMPQNLLETKPTLLVCVPRVLEKVYNKVHEKLGEQSGLIRAMFRYAVSLSKKDSLNVFEKVLAAFFDQLFFRKVRQSLGQRIRYIICGGAALTPSIAQFFKAAKINVLEGYGLTETSPVITVNRPEKNKIGTVGPCIEHVNIRLSEEGEILVKGPNVMLGYYRDEKATREVFTEDGYFRTGDIGELDEDGYLKITDRIKELIITSGGKKIAPAPIENELNSQSMIEQACLVGEGQKTIGALIVPNFEFLEKRARKMGITASTPRELLDYPK
ncbi:MAG: long-chain fatty acid--CoA ligase, partial [Bdellovibrionales bacterium]|nr:long-chain fatty acid--CoA ligase [Bdellovibrionales bacterium]